MSPIEPRAFRRRAAALLALVVIVACAPRPVERPREGAPPIAGGTPVRIENPVPPTLAAPAALAQGATPTIVLQPPSSPSPGLAASPAPLGSPGLPPIISGLQPAPGATLPAGDVVIGARVTGSSSLVDIVTYVDGEPVPIDLEGPGIRVKLVSFVRTFAGGTHEVRIQARDEHGLLGGYRWQFSVGAPREAAPPPTARPTAPTSPIVTRTPIAVPTRRPTIALPTPAPTAARQPAR